jgi:hypothetical protein
MEIQIETFNYDSEGNESSTISYPIKANVQSPSLEEIEKRSSEKKKNNGTDEEDFFSRKKKETPGLRTNIYSFTQKCRLPDTSDEYEEEDSEFTYNNSRKSNIITAVKKLKLISDAQTKKKNNSNSSEDSEEQETSSEDESDLFICKLPEKCYLIEENVFRRNPVFIIV